MSGSVGYDPDRIVELRNHTLWAIGALRGLSCSDPAADVAVAALAEMRRVLDETWMPTITEIERCDPLARPGGDLACVLGAMPAFRPGRAAATTVARAPTAGDTAAVELELLAALQHAHDATLTLTGRMADLDHPFWSEEFPALVELFRSRRLLDPAFDDFLMEHVGSLPAIGLIAQRGGFPPELMATLLRLLVTEPVGRISDYPGHLDLGTNALLEALADHPQKALDLLADREFATRLLTAPHLDPIAVGRFIQRGLVDAVAQQPDRLPQAYLAVEVAVSVANTPAVDRRGFAPATAQALVAALASFDARFLGGLTGGSDRVQVQADAETPFLTDLGSRDEFADFLGAIIRDPVSLVLLLGYCHDAARRSIEGDHEIPLSGVAKLSQMIDEAAQNEDLEIELDAASRIAFIERVFDIADVELLGLPRLASQAASVVHGAIERWTTAHVESGSIGVDGTHAYLTALIKVEIMRSFLDTQTSHGEAERARELLTQIDEQIADGASIEILAGWIPYLETAVRELGGEQYYSSMLTTADPDPAGRPREITDVLE